MIKRFFVVLCVLIASTFISVRAASADSCPIRLGYAGQVGLGAQHGTAEYELEFASAADNHEAQFTVSITADLSDGTQSQINVDSASTRSSEKVRGTSELMLFPFATEVSSFQIVSARDSKGLSTCTGDSPYSLDNDSASQSIRFDDGPTSLWPVKSPGAVEITDASFVSHVAPDVPLFAMEQGAEGEVRIFAVIRADGSIGSASIDRSSGYHLLDQAALEAMRKSKFRPAHLSAALGGEAITSAYFTIYQFDL